ncbi:MAG: pseudouridine synthase [Desulfovibrio sp.]|nr:pseudouridine synthase [Desulfovibrio sp.]
MTRHCQENGAGLALRCQEELAGRRLDHFLEILLPDMGLRGRRRSIATGAVLVNGLPGSARQRLRVGDRVEILPRRWVFDTAGDELRYLGRRGGCCCFYKPARLHTQSLAGGGGASLEALLPSLLRGIPEFTGDVSMPVLLQRLDYGTSGLVCAACDARTQAVFRDAEEQGRCEKRYLAVLEGQLTETVLVTNALNTTRRKRTVVMGDTAERVRWSEFWPLHFWGLEALPANLRDFVLDKGATLAACRIFRGARHQIRAHAAHMGFPLLGDTLYGSSRHVADDAGFFLHHGGISFPQARWFVAPPWTFLPQQTVPLVTNWLNFVDF